MLTPALFQHEQEAFGRFAEEMVGAQAEAARPRLLEAFQALHACHAACKGGMDRAGRRRFASGMREFVTCVRSLLHTQ
ncbi:unnamed protein product [Sphacelaria rigidula]